MQSSSWRLSHSSLSNRTSTEGKQEYRRTAEHHRPAEPNGRRTLHPLTGARGTLTALDDRNLQGHKNIKKSAPYLSQKTYHLKVLV